MLSVFPKRVTQLTLIFSLLSSYLLEVHASEPKSLIFAVNSPGSFPYLYFDTASQAYAGLLPDFFSDLEAQGLYKAVFVDSNQLRSEQFVIEGKVDLYLANKGWLLQPEKILTSKPIVHHLTYLYSLSPFADNFSVDTLVNNRICTHQEFIYTGLQDSFKTKRLVRVDSSSQETIGAMLAKGRCDYAILNNYNAYTVFTARDYCHLVIYQSPKPTSDIDLTIIMRPELLEIKTVIDKQIVAFNSSGKANNSLLSHSPKADFPKQATCN